MQRKKYGVTIGKTRKITVPRQMLEALRIGPEDVCTLVLMQDGIKIMPTMHSCAICGYTIGRSTGMIRLMGKKICGDCVKEINNYWHTPIDQLTDGG